MNIQLKDVDNVKFNGIDISAVKFNTVLVWQKWETVEYTGGVPVTVTANGEPLLDYLISGNMQQTGTPTPTTPIQPQETGEKTGNLFDGNWAQGLINPTTGEVNATDTSIYTVGYIPIKPNTIYSMSRDKYTSYNNVRFYDANKEYIGSGTVESIEIISGGTVANPMRANQNFCCFRIIANTAAYMRLNDLTNDLSVKYMLVEGQYTSSTMPSYQPYGYKIPISSGGENLWHDTPSSPDTSLNQNTGEELPNSEFDTYTIAVAPSTTYTVAFSYGSSAGTRKASVHQYNGNTWISALAVDDNRLYPKTVTTDSNATKIKISILKSTSNRQCNIGSTALPYSPYNRTTTPIYLGEVPTTRRIKKRVLTGDETWSATGSGASRYYRMRMGSYGTLLSALIICTHTTQTVVSTQTTEYGCNVINSESGNATYIAFRLAGITEAEDFKAYLASEYANGTPVTVWYVLATEQTGILNEPIRKIGDYADSISAEQAQVQIPTVSGANVVDIDTTLKPSSVYLKYKGKS